MRMINYQKCNWHKLLRVCIGRRRIKSTRINLIDTRIYFISYHTIIVRV